MSRPFAARIPPSLKAIIYALHTDVSLPIYSPTALVPSLYMRFAQLRGANPRVRLAFTELGERGLVTLAELGAAPETSDYDDEN